MKINFFRCTIDSDVDAVVHAAEPILAWQNTEQGQWVMENAYNVTWHKQTDALQWGTDILVRGEIHDPHKITEYFLRWPDKR